MEFPHTPWFIRPRRLRRKEMFGKYHAEYVVGGVAVAAVLIDVLAVLNANG